MHLGSSEPVSPAARVSAARDPPPASTEQRRPGHRPAALRGSVSSTCAATNWLHIPAARRPPSRRVEPRRRRRPVRARNKDERHSCILMAGRARNTDGTHTRTSSGARPVVSGPFSEACSWHSCSDFIACDKSSRLNCHVCDHQWRGAGPYASGFVACSPRRYRRIGRDSPATCLVRRGIH